MLYFFWCLTGTDPCWGRGGPLAPGPSPFEKNIALCTKFKESSLTLEFEKKDGQIRTNEIKNKYKNKKNKKTRKWQ